MTDSVVTVATIGCGYFSQFHHNAWQRLPARLVGIADRDKRKAGEFTKRYQAEQTFDDLEDMLDACRPDLLDIILPPDQHLAAIELGLAAGCHVICQKPFTLNLDQARRAVESAQRHRRLLVVHENFRFQPWYREIRRQMEGLAAGDIYQVSFRLRPGDGQGPEAYLDRQPYFQSMPQFLIKETGIHFIDVFRFLLGEPTSVFADLRQLNPAISGEDAGFFVLDFESGCRALFDGNRLADHAARNRRLIMGEMQVDTSRFTLNLDGDGCLRLREHGEYHGKQLALEFDRGNFGGDCVFALQQHVLDSIRQDTEPENIAASYLRNLEIQQAVYRSASEQRKIRL